MRKSHWLLLAVGVLLLAGCGERNDESHASSTQVSTTSMQQSTSQTATTETASTTQTQETSTTTQSEETDSTASTPESTTPSESLPVSDALAEVRERYADVALPTTIPHSQGNVVNVASDGTNDQLSVLYYDMPTAYSLNQSVLNNETPVGQFEKTTYNTAQEAALNVSVRVDMDGQTVDLGHGLTGYQQGAAGSSYVAWKEGNWNLLIRANNLEQQDPVAMAKKVVDYLEEAMLPAPDTIGQITIDMHQSGYLSNEVSWQEQAVVYTIHAQDPMAALVMAVSTN